jgi:hypothetical protein
LKGIGARLAASSGMTISGIGTTIGGTTVGTDVETIAGAN